MEPYIEVELNKEEKQAILKLARHFIVDANTISDLGDGRRKWIRFKKGQLTEVIGELAYHFNRAKSDYQYVLLDQLIDELESYE